MSIIFTLYDSFNLIVFQTDKIICRHVEIITYFLQRFYRRLTSAFFPRKNTIVRRFQHLRKLLLRKPPFFP